MMPPIKKVPPMTMLSLFLRSLFVASLLVGCHAYARPSPELWNVPVSHAPFWGRKAQIIELEQKLTKGPVVVTGLSGMGKSRLAFTYAKKQAHKYRIVWVFDASQGMDNQMINFANKLYASGNKGKKGTFSNKEDATHYVKTLLRTCTFSWLLIFDGVASFASATQYLADPLQDNDKHILLTSASSTGAPQTLDLTPLKDEEALELLTAGLPTEKEDDLKALAQSLENHAMALNQAVSYIKLTPGLDAQGYIHLFHGNKQKFWTSETRALEDQVLLHTSLKMSWEKLLGENPAAAQALCYFAMLNTHHIDMPVIEGWYNKTQDGDTAAFSYRKAQDIFDAISTHKVFDDMSEVLYKMFILGKKQAGTPQGNVLMIHAMDNHRGIFEKLHPRFIAMTRMSLDLPA